MTASTTAGRHTLMGRFVSATGQFLLATYGQFSRPPTGSSRCPLTDEIFERFFAFTEPACDVVGQRQTMFDDHLSLAPVLTRLLVQHHEMSQHVRYVGTLIPRLDVTRAPLRSADPDLGGSELNLARMRGAVCDSAPLLDTQRPRIPAQPSCNVAWTESRQRRVVSSRGRRPPIRQSVRCYSARSDRRFCFSLSASSSTLSARARLLSAWVRLA